MSVSSNSRPQAVLFDLDGTLIDSQPIYDKAFSQTFREFLGIEITDEDRRIYMQIPTVDFLRQYARGERLERLTDLLTRRIEDLMLHVRLFPGFEQVLPVLYRSGFGMGVVTSQTEFECKLTRTALNVNGWIDVWVTADDVEHHKPHPQPVLAALAVLNVQPDRALMVGDTLVDLQAGRAAGVPTAAACWGALEPERLLAFQPDYVLESPEDLLIVCTK